MWNFILAQVYEPCFNIIFLNNLHFRGHSGVTYNAVGRGDVMGYTNQRKLTTKV